MISRPGKSVRVKRSPLGTLLGESYQQKDCVYERNRVYQNWSGPTRNEKKCGEPGPIGS